MRRIVLFVASIMVAGVAAAAHDGSRGTAELAVGGGKVSVEYGRPALKGRNVEELVKPGQVWRMGADAATTLTTDVALTFGDKAVQPGKYVLRAKHVENQSWLLQLVGEDRAVIAEVPMKFAKSSTSEEHMAIRLESAGDGAKFVLHWGEFTLTTGFAKA